MGGKPELAISQSSRKSPRGGRRGPAILLRTPRFAGDALKAFIQQKVGGATVELIERGLVEDVVPNGTDLLIWRQLPDEADAIPALQRLGATGCAIILIADRYDARLVSRAMVAGLRGFVPAAMSSEALASIVDLVLLGGTYFYCRAEWLTPGAGPSSAPVELAGLTPRQIQVLAQVCRGMSNKKIARELGVNETTVKAHVMAIMRRLQLRNRTQIAIRFGDISPDVFSKLLDLPARGRAAERGR